MSFEGVNPMAFSMNREEFIRLVRKNLTHAQWVQLQDTERYLIKLFEHVDTRTLTEQEKKKIAAIIKQQNQDIWDLMYSACTRDAIEKYPELTTEARTKYAWNKAETLMLSEMYSPPHFTKQGECLECGPVLLPETYTESEVRVCPWCSVGFLSRFNKGEKTYEQ